METKGIRPERNALSLPLGWEKEVLASLPGTRKELGLTSYKVKRLLDRGLIREAERVPHTKDGRVVSGRPVVRYEITDRGRLYGDNR